MGEKEQGTAEDAAARSGHFIKTAGVEGGGDEAARGFIKMGSVEGERWKGAGDPAGFAINEPGVGREGGGSEGIAVGDEGVRKAGGGQQEYRAGGAGAGKTSGTDDWNPPAGLAGGGSGDPAEATNLNSSKSNVARTAGQAGGPPGPGPVESTNLNSSRSNIYRQGGPGDTGDPGGSELAIGDQGAVEEKQNPHHPGH